MKRFISAFLLMSGLLVAGGANAAVLSTVTNSAGGVCNVISLSGNVGDTFTFINNAGFALGLGISVSISPNPIPALATTNPVTLLRPGTLEVNCGVNILTITIAAPTAQAVPTLSEWTLMLLGLMVMATLGWYWNRERSY